MADETRTSRLPEPRERRSEDLESLAGTGRSIWVKILVVVVVAAGLCVRVAQSVVDTITPSGPVPRLLHTVEVSDLRVVVTADGTLQSSSNKDIKCKVKGGSTVLWVIEGGTVAKKGEVLVRLDRSAIEDTIATREIAYQTALAAYAQSESDVAVARINIQEYEKGTFVAEMKTKQMAVAVAEANLTVAKNTLQHSEKMFRKGFVSPLELQSAKFSIEQAQLDLDVKNTDLTVLSKYTKAKQLQDLQGILKAKLAKFASDKAALALEKGRLDRVKKQLANCAIVAPADGMVVFPNMARWKQAPDIEEGASVREDQVVLIMPDLKKMQVIVGVVEDKVHLLKKGLPCRVELQNGTIAGSVKEIATAAGRSGWWTGNLVKYDTKIKVEGPQLKPGMSAKVEIEVAHHKDVLTIPVVSVVQQKSGEYVSWVLKNDNFEKRIVELSDNNEKFVVVTGGLKEGDQVVLNPLAFVDDEDKTAYKPYKTKISKKKRPGKKPAKKAKGKSPKGKPAKSRQGKPAKSRKGKPAKGKPAKGKPQKTKPTK